MGAPPAGLTPESLSAAAERLERLASQPVDVTDPALPWNQDLSTLRLGAIDKHQRHNPSFRCTALCHPGCSHLRWPHAAHGPVSGAAARRAAAPCRVTTAANSTVFVKFPCVVGAKGLDASGACKQRMPPLWESTPQKHLDAIQRVSDLCGFSQLKSRTWDAPVTAATPEVGRPGPAPPCGATRRPRHVSSGCWLRPAASPAGACVVGTGPRPGRAPADVCGVHRAHRYKTSGAFLQSGSTA